MGKLPLPEIRIEKVTGQVTSRAEGRFGIVGTVRGADLIISFPFDQLPMLKGLLALSEQKSIRVQTTIVPEQVQFGERNEGQAVLNIVTPNDRFALILSEDQLETLRRQLLN